MLKKFLIYIINKIKQIYFYNIEFEKIKRILK
jgi:hypothetical protein